MRVSPEIENLVPYAPGKPIEDTQREFGLTDIYKLASNENPLGVSDRVAQAIQKEIPNLHRYPDPTCREVRQYLAKKWQWPETGFLIGNGSNELIDLVIRVYCEPGDRILMPQKSFIAYSVCAQAARVGKIEIPLDQNLKVEMESLLQSLKKKSSRDKILFLANPNNPTGTYLNQQELDEILKVCGGQDDFLVVVDEAYNEFVRAQDYPDTFSALKKHKNVLVLRTFSKAYGLAGLRVGALCGDESILNFIHRVRNPFNVNRLAQKAVIAAMEDTDYVKKSQELVWQGLDYFYNELEALGLPYVKSQGNFVLFNTLRDANEVFQACLKQGVILRTVYEYKLPSYLRMNVGLTHENHKAIVVLKQVLPGVKLI